MFLSLKKSLLIVFSLLLLLNLTACNQAPPDSKSTEANWRIFENNSKGYSLKVPPAWSTIGEMGGYWFDSNLDEGGTILGPNLPPALVEERDLSRFCFYIDKISENTNLSLYLNNYQNKPGYTSDIDTAKYTLKEDPSNTFTNQKSKSFSMFDEEDKYVQTLMLVENDNKIFKIRFNRDDVFHQEMLNSLKFLESTPK